MPRCSHCRKWIIGGIRQDELRFCSDSCYEDGFMCPLVEGIDDDFLRNTISRVHRQSCPLCKGDGPIDLYFSHTATSCFIYFQWDDSPEICCRRCGIKHVRKGILWTVVFGWWHSFGIVTATWQIINGVKQLIYLPDPRYPSKQLTRALKLGLAQRAQKRTAL